MSIMDFMKKLKTGVIETESSIQKKDELFNKRSKVFDKEFDLNIEKILENWEIFHAIREIIANAL